MGNFCASASSVVLSTPFDDALLKREESEREKGQALLRSMVTSRDTVDWAAVIAKAQELHAREQQFVRRRKRREKFENRRRMRKELARRKKEDAVGSFSVNMLAYTADGTCLKGEGRAGVRSPSGKGEGWCPSPTNSNGRLHQDDHSSTAPSNESGPASLEEFVSNRSWEEGMAPIDEKRQY